jgi:hypothetical protein
MNCHYCQQALTEIYKENSPPTVIVDLMCYTCHVHYEYIITELEEPLLTGLAFYNIHINNKEFEVQFKYVPKGTIVKRLTDNPLFGEPMEPAKIKKLVFTLAIIPNWTPFNIQEKLEMLLPFI